MVNEYMQYGIYPKVGTPMVCTVCRKAFKATDDTRYIRKGGYVCGWKCFMTPVGKETVAIDEKVDAQEEIIQPKSAKIAPKTKVKGANNTPKDIVKGANKSKTQKPTKKDEKNIKSTSTHKVVDLF